MATGISGTTAVTNKLNAAPLNNAAGNKQSFDIDLATNGWDVVAVQTDIAVGSSTSIDVNFYGSLDGSKYDTIPLAGSYGVLGSDETRTVPVGQGYLYIRCEIVDNDATEDGSVTVDVRGRLWSSNV